MPELSRFGGMIIYMLIRSRRCNEVIEANGEIDIAPETVYMESYAYNKETVEERVSDEGADPSVSPIL